MSGQWAGRAASPSPMLWLYLGAVRRKWRRAKVPFRSPSERTVSCDVSTLCRQMCCRASSRKLLSPHPSPAPEQKKKCPACSSEVGRGGSGNPNCGASEWNCGETLDGIEGGKLKMRARTSAALQAGSQAQSFSRFILSTLNWGLKLSKENRTPSLLQLRLPPALKHSR